jgi:hypothetical protein
VCRCDRDAALTLFGSVVDLIERFELCTASRRQNIRNRCRQSRLAVVNVTDRPNVDMGFGPFKLGFGHGRISLFSLAETCIAYSLFY